LKAENLKSEQLRMYKFEEFFFMLK